MRQLAVVGAGWAGLAAAVRARQAGESVQVFEMAGQAGGRARRLPDTAAAASPRGLALDNGQHLLIGAYGETLGLMAELGIDLSRVLLRLPLRALDPQGHGLALPPGGGRLALLRGVLGACGWSWRERLALLRASAGWALQGFRLRHDCSVAELGRGLPAGLRRGLIDPLCVAALNTAPEEASAQVFLRVLKDALLGPRGSSDLLLPREDLGALLPDPAAAWLADQAQPLSLGRRVQALHPLAGGRWQLEVQGPQGRRERHEADGVVLACPPGEAARLVGPLRPDWAAQAAALTHRAIVTVLVATEGERLGEPLLMLRDGPGEPGQWIFDWGQLRDTAQAPGAHGLWAVVVSAAEPWLPGGLPRCGQAVLDQLAAQAGPLLPPADPARPRRVLRVLAEKRATFAATVGLVRPEARILQGLWAAGDHVAGPYPATLEGAVRSGRQAVNGLRAEGIPPGPGPGPALSRS